MKWIKFTVACAFVIAAASFTAVRFGGVEARRLRAAVDALEQEKRDLLEYARRLGASRRVAQVDVVRQRVDDQGRTTNTLLWQEIGPDGIRGRPLAVETIGDLVYFEALVIKFEPRHVGEGDPERGTSLALFRRVFGECQTPQSVAELDRSARPPLEYSGNSGSLKDELWRRFWEMVDEPRVAATYGVRIAQVEAPAVPVQPGQIWEVALDAAGGLNLRRILAGSSGDGQTASASVGELP